MNGRSSCSLKLLLLIAAIYAGLIGSQLSAVAQVLRSASPLPSFAVASIRPAAADSPDGGLAMLPKGSLSAKSTTLKTMILFAYGLGNDDELSGGPDWVRSDRFELDTRIDEAQAAALDKLSADDRSVQMRFMLQSLLAERFHLKVHSETKELPVYSLVIAKTGLKCTEQAADTSPFASLPQPRFRMSVGPPPPPPPPGWHPPITPEEIQAHAVAPMHFRTKGWPFWMVVTVLSHQPEPVDV